MAHLDHGRHRPDVAEDLPMHVGHLLPILDAGEQDAGAHDVRERSAEPFERLADDGETAPRLPRRIAGCLRLTVRPDRRGAGDGDEPAGPDRARNPHPRLVGTAGGVVSTH